MLPPPSAPSSRSHGLHPVFPGRLRHPHAQNDDIHRPVQAKKVQIMRLVLQREWCEADREVAAECFEVGGLLKPELVDVYSSITISLVFT